MNRKTKTLSYLLAVIGFCKVTLLRLCLASPSDNASYSESGAPGNAEAGEVTKSDGPKVLVIDDDKGYGDSVSFIFRTQPGAQVEAVDSGAAGIARVRDGRRYDLILLDVMMPDLNGIETYYILKQIDPNIRVVFMSVDPSTEEWKTAESLASVLPKPIPPDELTRLLIT